jgi:hypothetical protein
MADDVIWIVTDRPLPVELPDGTKSGGGTGNRFNQPDVETGNPNRIPVEAKKLQESVTKFLQVMGGVIRNAKHDAGDLGEMELDEIELTVEVNGEGQLSLLGNGGKAGGKGSMTLKFKMMKSTSVT